MAAIMIHNVSVSKIENKLKLNSKRPTTRHSRTVLTDATYVIKPSSCLLVVGLGGQLFTGCWPWWSAVYWLLALVVSCLLVVGLGGQRLPCLNARSTPYIVGYGFAVV